MRNHAREVLRLALEAGLSVTVLDDMQGVFYEPRPKGLKGLWDEVTATMSATVHIEGNGLRGSILIVNAPAVDPGETLANWSGNKAFMEWMDRLDY